MAHSLRDYGVMIADEVRVAAYAQAMRQVIRPGDVVLDLGAGTGVFSLLACQLGARHVHACDFNPAIQVARELSRRNGFADRITCHETRSDRLTLPEPVDVLVSDLRGVMPLHGRHIPSLVDARTRHLKAGGILLPKKDLLFVALAEAPDDHQRAVTPWGRNDFGCDLRPWSALLANSWIPAKPQAWQLVSAPALWGELTYATVTSSDLRGSVTCVATRSSTVHGLYLWFDATIADGVSFSCGPNAADLPYGCAFLPWHSPLVVQQGEVAQIQVDASLIGADYNWTWEARVGETHIRQSTFLGAPISPETLRRLGGHVTELNREGRATLLVLEALSRHRPLERIAEELVAQLPGRFASQAECLGFVGDLSLMYGA